MTDRYKASIDGFAIDVQTLEDGFKKAIARYEYPYRDGADTEDMGEEARVIRIRCYWLEETYEDHFRFVEHLKKRDLFELSHPKYGLIQGRIESISIRHDDRQETAEVDISFVQDLGSQEQSAAYVDVEAATEEAFITGQQELMENFASAVRDSLGTEAEGILLKVLDPDLGIVEQYPEASIEARDYLEAVEDFVVAVQTEAADVANPANTLLATIDYGTKLPGRVIGPLARAAERHALLLDSLRTAPVRFIRNLNSALTDLADAAGDFGPQTRIASAQRLALDTATLFREDEAARQKMKRREAGRSFDALGNYLSPEPLDPVMTVNDLEQTLAEVRGELQAGVDFDRSLGSLKAMARQLLEHATQIKLERDRIVSIRLDNTMPLHLVCLMRGLPYGYAERIMAINDIAHPNFTAGEVSVYVR